MPCGKSISKVVSASSLMSAECRRLCVSPLAALPPAPRLPHLASVQDLLLVCIWSAVCMAILWPVGNIGCVLRVICAAVSRSRCVPSEATQSLLL
jgi:hypothetical protein